MTEVPLPLPDGSIETYQLARTAPIVPVTGVPESRIAFAAAHVVADPLGDRVGSSAIDWEATLAFRRFLWSLGLGVAEAMDTAQRGMGLDPESVRLLIDRSTAEARGERGAIVCGINTDDLPVGRHTRNEIIEAYQAQLSFVEDRGAVAVMMASRPLAATAEHIDEYADVYGSVLAEASRPVILHWLGPMFDPQLTGYWGSKDPHVAMDSLLRIVGENAHRIDGVKISMLDAQLEMEFRRRLPDGIRCYTGDDFNFPDLIAGDDEDHSDALLGIFDAIAPVAVTALHALDGDDVESFHRLLDPTVPLARVIFEAPTIHYKTGLVFLAYLNGHQDHFRMVGGHEGARSVLHLAEVVRHADGAGLFADPELVATRLLPVLRTAGVV